VHNLKFKLLEVIDRGFEFSAIFLKTEGFSKRKKRKTKRSAASSLPEDLGGLFVSTLPIRNGKLPRIPLQSSNPPQRGKRRNPRSPAEPQHQILRSRHAPAQSSLSSRLRLRLRLRRAWWRRRQRGRRRWKSELLRSQPSAAAPKSLPPAAAAGPTSLPPSASEYERLASAALAAPGTGGGGGSRRRCREDSVAVRRRGHEARDLLLIYLYSFLNAMSTSRFGLYSCELGSLACGIVH
jgi:hypothetical protein